MRERFFGRIWPALAWAVACGGPQTLGEAGAKCYRDDDCVAGLICVKPAGKSARVCSNDATPIVSMVDRPPVVPAMGGMAAGGSAGAPATAGRAGGGAGGAATATAGTSAGGGTAGMSVSGGTGGATETGGSASAGTEPGTGGTSSTAGTAADGGAPP